MSNYKKVILLFLGLSGGPWCLGQIPDWVDENKRNRGYSSEFYLKGFVTEGKVQENEKTISRLKDLAKSELIESIQVSIQSKSELKEEEKKNSFQQNYLFESSSFSEADIYGLETTTFYDKKQKRAFAFAFVKKEKLISYFKSVISLGFSNNEQRFKNISSKIDNGNLEGALSDVFAIGDELKSIYKAESILQAIGIGDNSILRKDQYLTDKNKRAEVLTTILNSSQLSAKNLVTYFVGSINQNVIDKKKAKVFVKSFRFQDYSLSSGLATALAQLFSTEFSKTENLTLVPDSASSDCILKGFYNDSPEKVTVNISVKDKSNSINKLSAAVSVKALQNDKIEFLPIEIQKMRLLNFITLTSDLKKITVKCNQVINTPYKIKASTSLESKSVVSNIPVSFLLNNQVRPLSVILANESGDVAYTIVSIKSPAKFQKLTASVDLATYINIDTVSTDFRKIKKEAHLPTAILNVTVTGNVLFCSSRELNLGNELTTSFLREGVKDALSKIGFAFTTDIAQADYVLKIESNTRKGSSFDDLFFSYLDASVTLIDQSQKKEVFSSQYAEIKGAGTNYEGAGIKAYSSGVKKIEKDLSDYFMK